jgi:hypothetical protein
MIIKIDKIDKISTFRLQQPNMASNRPTRTIRPAQKLNEDNIGSHQLTSHRNFVKAAKDPQKPSSLTSPNTEPSTQGLVTDFVPESDKRRTTSAENFIASSASSDNDNNSESQETEHQSNKKKRNAGMSTSQSFL